MTARSVAVLAGLAWIGGCGGSGPFALTAADNDPLALERIVANLDGARTGPINRRSVPFAAVVSKAELSLVDVNTAAAAWTVTAAVTSRVVFARDVLVASESAELVARDLSTGSPRWRVPVGGSLVGLDADSASVFVTVKNGNAWSIRALAADSGSERWSASSGGVLGAPVAWRGVVLVPFLNQWLSILDARSGKSLTRVRGVEEEITFARTIGADAFFGSKRGVFLLDVRAASGSRAHSTYATAKLPQAFAALSFARDGYDEAQADYNAFDQRQIAWNASADGDVLAFGGGLVTAHYYRFLFGIAAADGGVRWAYNHGRHDLMAARNVGGLVFAIASDASIAVLDATSGALLHQRTIEAIDGVRGVTFDVAGWRPPGTGEPANTIATLAEILADKDSRFASIKRLAIDALAASSSTAATTALIDVARQGKPPLSDRASAALIRRADPSGASVLVTEIEKPQGCLATCARAFAAIDPSKLSTETATRAESALLRHFESPATGDIDFAAVAQALAVVAGPASISAMRQFFLVHRADPAVAENQLAVAAIAGALAKAGGSARAAVVFAASDPLTHAGVASEAKRALTK